MVIDIESLEARLAAGEALKIKYRYPIDSESHSPAYGVRTDKLVDVSVERRRFYTLFRGTVPIWIEEEEVIEITPDDGEYCDFPVE
jgi:hypothetical protein